MNIAALEQSMYDLSDLLLSPVLLMIIFVVCYAVFAIGKFAGWYVQRKKNKLVYTQHSNGLPKKSIKGYPVHNYLVAHPTASFEELEVYALKLLENLRLVTRLAPMLGLIATMIPMGPALKSLADGNVQGISENLVVAFAAVIWGLLAASLTFWPATVQKRWLAAELTTIDKNRKALSKLEQESGIQEAA
ncbi:MotA/TolQ/ExbB proton channel family protein [Colwellia sp. 1_MG-2023]|uniref:MotA/TolQ/ExbB proton channel family protein n=1 Tax=Colwellia sp. 1_MG-2023 TaxID=3062649 RepID=UPI0026E2CBF0|nr:MotA/TolQ/ExbB proton channel family protein [Colwellia sp. 1_MG-2023]MDO6446526.1 MotA/TolQ/ExbB proton channel family protein [Colwellia sp. 1_MG-2023]